MSRWKENISPAPPHSGSSSNPSPLLPCKRPLHSPCPPPRRPLADVSGNALQQRASGAGGVGPGEGIDYGYITPLPKVPRSCGFLPEDDDMDEAFLLEVDAICEEHSRSMAGKVKGRGKDSTVDPGPVVVAAAVDAGPECLTLDDAFWKEANTIFEECNAHTAAKSHDEELKEMEEDESLVLSCGDDSLLPAISIADDGVKLEDAFWEVNAISKDQHAMSSAKNQEEIDEVDLEDGSVALGVDFPPVISIAEEGGEVVDAFLGEVNAIREEQAAMSAAEDKDEHGEMGLEMEEDDGCAPRKYYEYWHSLNDRQREAACSDVAVPLMIVAGPGSGKTSTMVGRVLTLLKEGIPPSNILAMTFTTAAASEMRDRIGAVVGKAVAKEIIISTFHSFCLQLCRTHACSDRLDAEKDEPLRELAHAGKGAKGAPPHRPPPSGVHGYRAQWRSGGRSRVPLSLQQKERMGEKERREGEGARAAVAAFIAVSGGGGRHPSSNRARRAREECGRERRNRSRTVFLVLIRRGARRTVRSDGRLGSSAGADSSKP